MTWLASALLALVPSAPGTAGTAVLESATGEVQRRPLSAIAGSDLRGLGASFIRFEGLDPWVAPAGGVDRATVVLSNGDGLEGRVAGGRGDDLRLGLVGGAEVVLSIDALRSLRFDARLGALLSASMSAAPETDRLYWIRAGNLDWDDGTLVELSDEGIEFEGRIGTKLYPWDEVAGLFLQELAGADPRPSRADESAVVVDLVDLGRLRGRLVRIDEQGCELELVGGAELVLPLATVAEIAVDDGSITFVSDLEPRVDRAGSPFDDDLGLTWPHVRDRSVTGAPLRVGGMVYTRGLGVHAPSRLVFALDGGYSLLRGAVAIDDQVKLLAARGSVEFRVLIDGEQRWSSGVVRGGEPPRALAPLDVTGARELVLEVDMATDYHVADRADWLRVLLVRSD